MFLGSYSYGRQTQNVWFHTKFDWLLKTKETIKLCVILLHPIWYNKITKNRFVYIKADCNAFSLRDQASLIAG